MKLFQIVTGQNAAAVGPGMPTAAVRISTVQKLASPFEGAPEITNRKQNQSIQAQDAADMALRIGTAPVVAVGPRISRVCTLVSHSQDTPKETCLLNLSPLAPDQKAPAVGPWIWIRIGTGQTLASQPKGVPENSRMKLDQLTQAQDAVVVLRIGMAQVVTVGPGISRVCTVVSHIRGTLQHLRTGICINHHPYA